MADPRARIAAERIMSATLPHDRVATAEAMERIIASVYEERERKVEELLKAWSAYERACKSSAVEPYVTARERVRAAADSLRRKG